MVTKMSPLNSTDDNPCSDAVVTQLPRWQDLRVGILDSRFAPSMKGGRTPHYDHWTTMVPLWEVLQRPWTSDAMIVGYRVVSGDSIAIRNPRLSHDPWCTDEIRSRKYSIETTIVMVDVDLHSSTSGKAPWGRESSDVFTEWWNSDHEILQHAGCYHTRHGFRLFWVLNAPVDTLVMAEPLVSQVFHELRATGLETIGNGVFGIDVNCRDWTRLMRVPRARVETGTNLLPSFEDYARVRWWTPPPVSSEALEDLAPRRSYVARAKSFAGPPLAQPPVEWLPAADLMGDALRDLGDRGRQPQGFWHQTYLAIAGSFLQLNAPPEGIEALVSRVVDRDPRWCNLRAARVADARSTVSRWCAGGGVSGLAALNKVLGISVVSRFRALAPVVPEPSVPMLREIPSEATSSRDASVSPQPDFEEMLAAALASLDDTDRAKPDPAEDERDERLSKNLAAQAEPYRKVLEERQQAAEALEGALELCMCQRAVDLAMRLLPTTQEHFRGLGVASRCGTGYHGLQNLATGTGVGTRLRCRQISCLDCGPLRVAHQVAGAFVGPVRHNDGNITSHPLSAVRLWVYDLPSGDLDAWLLKHRRSCLSEELKQMGKNEKSDAIPSPPVEGDDGIRSISSAPAWVAFVPPSGSVMAVTNLRFHVGKRGRKGRTWHPVRELNTYEEVVAFALEQITRTFVGVMAFEAIEGVGDQKVIGGKIRSSDNLTTDPRVIRQKASPHQWVKRASKVELRDMAAKARQQGIPMSAGIGQEGTEEVSVSFTACSSLEVDAYWLSVDQGPYHPSPPGSRTDGCAPQQTEYLPKPDFDAMLVDLLG